MTSGHRLVTNEVVVSGLTQSAGQLLCHARGLERPAEKAGYRAGRDPGTTGQVDRLPALGDHVGPHSRDVVDGSSLQSNDTIRRDSLRCQEQTFAGRCRATRPGYDGDVVGNKRPVFNAELGQFFVSLREAKGWKQSQAADVATRRKIPVTYQTR